VTDLEAQCCSGMAAHPQRSCGRPQQALLTPQHHRGPLGERGLRRRTCLVRTAHDLSVRAPPPWLTPKGGGRHSTLPERKPLTHVDPDVVRRLSEFAFDPAETNAILAEARAPCATTASLTNTGPDVWRDWDWRPRRLRPMRRTRWCIRCCPCTTLSRRSWSATAATATAAAACLVGAALDPRRAHRRRRAAPAAGPQVGPRRPLCQWPVRRCLWSSEGRNPSHPSSWTPLRRGRRRCPSQAGASGPRPCPGRCAP
jgi:hypothetical protein